MRPLRLLLSLCSSLIAVIVLLYVAFSSQAPEDVYSSTSSPKQSRFKTLLSFTSPSSLFPPSAIISLTDDNSTFFLARPAAFGPMLPSKGLSGPLWIGSGFGDDTILGRGELGCSDVPGWNDEDSNIDPGVDLGKISDASNTYYGHPSSPKTTSALRRDAVKESNIGEDDGTDEHFYKTSMASKGSTTLSGKASGHADIQSLQEDAEIAGKVVLLKRGGCGFLDKVKWAQRRGGIAVIVGDDVRGGALIRMYAHGDTSNVTISALFTSHTTAHLLSSLLPSGGLLQDLSAEDAAKLRLMTSGKGGKNGKSKDKSTKKESESQSTFTRAVAPTNMPKSQKQKMPYSANGKISQDPAKSSWLRSFLSALGFGEPGHSTSQGDNRRPPSSGNLDWVLVDDWDEDHSGVKNEKDRSDMKYRESKPTQTPNPDGFVIGEQDWRDPDLLPPQSTRTRPQESQKPKQETKTHIKGGSVLPSSGEYDEDGESADVKSRVTKSKKEHKEWFSHLFDKGEEEMDSIQQSTNSMKHTPPRRGSNHHGGSPDDPEQHEGLWVTLTPTNMSTSPFFDTLLVLVVSPLVTLTVVYALLLLRSRIRRQRWRAPKSIVERLPVRTYQTISDSSSSAATPTGSSPTTPLLQHSPSRPTSSRSRPRSRTTSEVPATSSSFQQSRRTPEEEKREAGLAEWRRRYGGRQRECVVCLEEYVDGVSRVMSLPCGHEFHEECITPWLVTRRRTCPICKGDVVRSLSQSFRNRSPRSLSPMRSPRPFQDDDLQAQAAETRNESPSASQPVPTVSSMSASNDELDTDIEANWDREHERDLAIPRDRTIDLSSSIREMSSTVVTTIWRGFEAIRGATGFQLRSNREEIDRDR
ncbi:hypothetical protein CC78DRAFT_124721 [Lojkania enalia]|uniref:RING-type domain-containing protein n=1 Tax=Lojkania enalia TaxID=147567 RepID=A0A9P4JWR3_9PLEO|nr:hypothetical protein CC78DRAFT_124721 [Didymosphaeria enalia]